MSNDLISVVEAAKVIGTDPSQVRRYIRSGLLPATPVSGVGRPTARYLVRRQHAEAFERPPRGYPKGRTRRAG